MMKSYDGRRRTGRTAQERWNGAKQEGEEGRGKAR